MNDYSKVFEQLGQYGIGILIIILLMVLAAIVVYILFLVSMNNTIKAVSLQNRKIQPGIPFLLLAPSVINMFVVFSGMTFISIIINLAGAGLLFYVVKSIADSLEAEYLMRGMAVTGKPTYSIGITYVLLNAIAAVIPIVISNTTALGAITLLLELATLVLFIIYWVQLVQHKNILKQAPAFQAGTSQIF